MSELNQRLTHDARRVLGLAQEEADRQGVAIDTDHLLLGLLRNERGAAGQILRLMGLNADQVEAWVRRTGQRIEFPHQSSNEQPQPLLILDGNRSVLVSNEAAQDLIDHHSDELVNAFRNISGTSEVTIEKRRYLTLSVPLSSERTIVILHDITHVKELERAMSQHVLTVFSELKGPLVAINGWVELLRQHTPLDEMGQRFVDRIPTSVGTMLELMNNLSDNLRAIDAAFIAAHSQPCDFKRLVDTEVADLQDSTERTSITIDSDLPVSELWVSGVEWALARMLRVLVNLATKKSSNGRDVRIRLTHTANSVQLHVQSQEEVPAKNAMSDFRKLELWMARSIAEAHGGTLEVNSIPGGGSEFVVVLPAASPTA